MTNEQAIEIIENIDPQCQKDCPISRDECGKQNNVCLMAEALKLAVDALRKKRATWTADGACSACGVKAMQVYGNYCCFCGAEMEVLK